MTRADLTEKLLDIKREKGWSWKQICAEIGGMSPVLVTPPGITTCFAGAKLTQFGYTSINENPLALTQMTPKRVPVIRCRSSLRRS